MKITKKSANISFIVSLFISGLVLSVLASFAPVFTPSASAQSDPVSPTEHAKIYQSWRFMVECAAIPGPAGSSFITDPRDRSQLERADVFTASGERADIAVGYLLDPSDNGRLMCDDQSDSELAIQASGINGYDLFVGSGVYVPGDGGFRLSDKSEEERITAITNYYGARYPTIQFTHDRTLEGGVQYFMMLAAFEQKCVRSADGDGNVTIKYVSVEDGSVVERKFFTNNPGSVNVGYGNSQGSDQQMSCNELVEYINRFADSAARLQTNYFNQGGGPEVPSETAAGSASEDTGPSCESEGGSMSWIICPALEYMDKAIASLDDAIIKLLTIPNEFIDNPSMERTWARMRNIAYLILVPIALFMVISTALGFEFVSAYTVKRALPRLVIAAIFIALSYEVVVFMVNATNNISIGLGNLITSAMTGGTREITLSSVFTPTGQDSAVGVAVGLGIGVGLLATVSIGVVLSYAFVLLISLLIAFFLLSFRQMLVIALAIMAPLAILSWIFPGNDKLWKLWWNTFTKLLLLFPIIMVLIAVGKSFAWLINVLQQFTDSADSPIYTLMKLLVYIAPFFLIPAMFKFAGGVFATVSGMANDRTKGLFDRQKKYRSAKMADNWRKTRSFNRFNDRGLGGMVNTALGVASNPVAARSPGKMRALRSSQSAMLAAEELKNDAVYQANQNDDKFLLALGNRNRAEQKLAKAKADGDLGAAAAWQTALDSASLVKSRNSDGTKLHAINAVAATGYQHSAGQAGYNELAEDIASITGAKLIRSPDGNVMGAEGPAAGAFANAMNSAQYGMKGAGRYDLAGINNGTGWDPDSGLGKASLYQLANGKKESIKAMTEKVKTQPVGEEAAIAYAELQAMQPNATGAVAAEIEKQMKELESMGVGNYMKMQTGETKQVRRNWDGKETGWTLTEQQRGWRMQEAPETFGDRAQQKARTYQRPDPNNMD